MSAWFVAEVEKFCAFVEGATAELAIVDRLVIARQRLLALYAAALTLPVEPEAGLVHEVPRAHVAHWPGFGDFDLYWETYDPAEDNLVGTSITDDLIDIHADVARGLALWRAGHEREAIWEWRFHLDTHWGVHAIDALRALHWAINRARGYQ